MKKLGGQFSRFDTVRKRDEQTDTSIKTELGPVSIQTQSLALRALRKRKPQERQALAFEWKWKPGFSHTGRLSSITVPTQIHKSSVQVVKYKVVITTADPRNARRIKRSRAPLPIGNDCSTLRDGCRGGKNLKLHFSLERAPLPKNCSLAIGL